LTLTVLSPSESISPSSNFSPMLGLGGLGDGLAESNALLSRFCLLCRGLERDIVHCFEKRGIDECV